VGWIIAIAPGLVLSLLQLFFSITTKLARSADVAAGIVTMGIVEAAKTTPPPLGTKPRTGTKKLSRLALGEPNVAGEVAVATGAIYIEINPGVLKML
jgi:hypothetical protein